MRAALKRAAMGLAALLLVLPPGPEPARANDGAVWVAAQPPGPMETTMASCTGSAVIGAIVGATVFVTRRIGGIVPPAVAACVLSLATNMVNAASDHLTRLVESVFASRSPDIPETLP